MHESHEGKFQLYSTPKRQRSAHLMDTTSLLTAPSQRRASIIRSRCRSNRVKSASACRSSFTSGQSERGYAETIRISRIDQATLDAGRFIADGQSQLSVNVGGMSGIPASHAWKFPICLIADRCDWTIGTDDWTLERHLAFLRSVREGSQVFECLEGAIPVGYIESLNVYASRSIQAHLYTLHPLGGQ
jgi:hypothetical protein